MYVSSQNRFSSVIFNFLENIVIIFLDVCTHWQQGRIVIQQPCPNCQVAFLTMGLNLLYEWSLSFFLELAVKASVSFFGISTVQPLYIDNLRQRDNCRYLKGVTIHTVSIQDVDKFEILSRYLCGVSKNSESYPSIKIKVYSMLLCSYNKSMIIRSQTRHMSNLQLGYNMSFCNF